MTEMSTFTDSPGTSGESRHRSAAAPPPPASSSGSGVGGGGGGGGEGAGHAGFAADTGHIHDNTSSEFRTHHHTLHTIGGFFGGGANQRVPQSLQGELGQLSHAMQTFLTRFGVHSDGSGKSFWRSQEMHLVSIYIQSEAAHLFVDELGHLALLEFRDVRRNTHTRRTQNTSLSVLLSFSPLLFSHNLTFCNILLFHLSSLTRI